MNHTKDAVTICFILSDDTEAVDVGQARERQLFFLHLTPDRVGLFSAPDNLGLDARFVELKVHVVCDSINHIVGFVLQRNETAHDRGAALWIENFERKVFKLFAHPLHTHTARKRSVNVHGLTRFLRLFFRAHGFDRAHVVQTVSQFDKNHAQIARHGDEQLAEVLGLFCLGGGEL